MLTLFDASGRVLADNNDFGGDTDPLLAFTVPADGRYVVAGQRSDAGRQRASIFIACRSANWPWPPACFR